MELSPKLIISEGKTSLSKYKKIEIIPCILSVHNTLKQELNNKKNSRKNATSQIPTKTRTSKTQNKQKERNNKNKGQN
jgi:hypothetical protein